MDNETKQMFQLIINKLDKVDVRLDKMDSRLDNIERKQDEMYLMQRALEENVKVTRAEQEKMMYIVADIQGKVTTLTEEVDEHERVINQIKAI
ncbi:hypothetical protein [Clostridium sp. DL1XJH146]